MTCESARRLPKHFLSAVLGIAGILLAGSPHVAHAQSVSSASPAPTYVKPLPRSGKTQAVNDTHPYATPAPDPFNPADEEDPRPKVKIDTAQFDRFGGYYELEHDTIFTIYRIGDTFFAQVNGSGLRQGPRSNGTRLYAQDPVTFFARRTNDQCPLQGLVQGRLPTFPWFCEPGRAIAIRFVTDAAGSATELVLYQDGLERHAPRLDYATAAKASIQAGNHIAMHLEASGTYQALRGLLISMQRGTPDYGAVTPGLAAVLKEQYPAASAAMKPWGTLKNLWFRGVDRTGADIYLAIYEHVHAMCAIMPLTADGKITDESCRRGPDDDTQAGF